MGRIHLFEFGDLPWFPRTLHRYLTDYLAFLQNKALGSREQLLGLIEILLAHAGERRVIDLCSGAGGPWPALGSYIAQRGKGPVHVTLTDLEPHVPALEQARAAGGESIDIVTVPVDAMHIPAELQGARTIFNGFHHFRPAQARAVLADAAASGQPIGIFEITGRNAVQVVTAPLLVLLVLAVTPFLRPLRASRLLLTYVLPVLPLVIAWDGLVSMLRGYSADELGALTASIDAPPGYRWEIGALRIGPVKVPYLLGYAAEDRPGAGR